MPRDSMAFSSPLSGWCVAAALAAGLELGAFGAFSPQAASAQDAPPNYISHGAILGRPTAHSMGVWARTGRPGGFRIRYGLSLEQRNALSPVVTTTLDHDNTGWSQLPDLEPDTRYYYRVETEGGEIGPGGSFRTLPDPRQYVDEKLNPDGRFNFAFEFACGNNQSLDHGSGHSTPAFATMLRELRDRIHFSIQNGDWLYEDEREYTPGQWLSQVGAAPNSSPHVVRVAPTIAGVWENYKIYLRRSHALAEYHRNIPTLFTFDDHEILNDVWGAGTPGLRDRRAVFRDIGVQAWYDYLGWSNPVDFEQAIHFGRAELEQGSDILIDRQARFSKLDLSQAATLHVHWGEPTAGVNDNALDEVGGVANAGVYEIVEALDDKRLRIRPAAKADGRASFSIGRRSYYRFRVGNCEFFCTDTRTHRQLHDTADPGKKGLSMLGVEQRKWLLDSMRASDAEFLFVVSSVNFMVPHVGGGKVRATNKDDAWTVFLDERESLIQAWDQLGKPVCVLTGDLHNSFVIKITDRVWEFASGPHNSNNHKHTDEGDRPANGKFKYGPRECDIRWSTYFLDDIPRDQLRHPTYCVVQVNNVFNSPLEADGAERWVAFPQPQVIFQYYSGKTGQLLYAESIVAPGKPPREGSNAEAQPGKPKKKKNTAPEK